MSSKLCFSYSDELRKEARQLKKDLQAIKQRKEDRDNPKEQPEDQPGKSAYAATNQMMERLSF